MRSKEEILKQCTQAWFSEVVEMEDATSHVPFNECLIAMETYMMQMLRNFKPWYDSLSPAEKCTVWPPAGSGGGHGLYNMSDEDLIDKFLRLHKNKILTLIDETK